MKVGNLEIKDTEVLATLLEYNAEDTETVMIEGYVFTREMIEEASEKILYGKKRPRCANCGQLKENHMNDGKCLYLPTYWE